MGKVLVSMSSSFPPLGLSHPTQPDQRPLLILSNGHGEDQVACRIAQALQQFQIPLQALPIVGEGHAYQTAGIPVLGSPQAMPSGGFIYQDWRQFWRDLRGGLWGLTLRQLGHLRQHRQQARGILAVGDIVVLLMAWWSGIPFWFVGTAKSDYYWRDEQGAYRPARIPLFNPQSDYLPWERWLMRRPQCRGVFVRDRLTAEGLQKVGIPALDLGNPMMDGLASPPPAQITSALDRPIPTLLLLPGSRPPEAYHNWALMMQVVGQLSTQIKIQAAIAGGLDPERLQSQIPSGREIQLSQEQFGATVSHSTVVLAMAGTATEQCVGLGKPVVIMPGAGPQFTPRFAEAQTRLLGSSVHLASVQTAAEVIQSLCDRLEQDSEYADHLRQHGLRRMGSPGASQRIAAQMTASGAGGSHSV